MVAMNEKFIAGGARALPAGTQPMVDNLHQGMTLDSVTGLYYARNRSYSPSLGRWINQDPAGYINGANTYQFVESSPVGNVDPGGLDVYLFDMLSLGGGIFFHQAIAVGGGGRYFSVSYGPVHWGVSGPGIVTPENGWHWRTSAEFKANNPLLAAAFDQTARRYLESLLGPGRPYNVFTHNCRQWAQKHFEHLKKMYPAFKAKVESSPVIPDIMNEQNPTAVPSGASPVTT